MAWSTIKFLTARPSELEGAVDDPRQAMMASHLAEGRTLQEVGDLFSLTRERVRQIVKPVAERLPRRALLCSVDGCRRPYLTVRPRTLCELHWRWLRETGVAEQPPPRAHGPAEWRFWRKVDKRGPDECWPWKAAVKPSGYGHFQCATGDHRLAHAFSAELHGLAPPGPGLWLLHSCHNKQCVNPAHLYYGTASDNAKDRERNGGGRARFTQDELDLIVAHMSERKGTLREESVALAAALGAKANSIVKAYYRERSKLP